MGKSREEEPPHVEEEKPPVALGGGAAGGRLPWVEELLPWPPLHQVTKSSCHIVNVFAGDVEERMMMTGSHTVADIFCVGCGSIVGWKYETAHEKAQKYKEGKSVLERFKLSGPDGTHYWISPEVQVGSSDADDV